MNPYHSGTVSPRRVLSMSGTSTLLNEKGTLPLPSSSSSSKRKRIIRLPLGLNLTTSGGPLRRWPLLLAIITSFLLFATLLPRSSHSINLSTPDLDVPVRADFQREMHAVDEEDTIAEDDLVVQNEVEQPSKTPEEIREAAEAKKEYALSVAKDKSGQLRALVYWITRGGTFPDDWELPPKAKMEELKVDGFRDLLGDLHGEDVSDVFGSEWEKDADLYNRVTVFSKSYCPHCARAKKTLDRYPINPEPYVIEIDERADAATVQSVLYYLTGRRTVPNVLVEFESLGGADELELFDGEGVLGRRVLNNPHVAALRKAQGVRFDD